MKTFLNFINESKQITIENFLNYFPDDTKSWRDATEEIKEVVKKIRELGEFEILNYKHFKTPSEWNTKSKEYILKYYDKLDSVKQKEVLRLIQGFNFHVKENIYESKINTDEQFRKFVYDRLKLKFGKNFDEQKAEKIVLGILNAVEEDGITDYSTAIGLINH